MEKETLHYKDDREEVLEDLECLVKSCEEGIDGTWDGSVSGFEAMIEQLEGVIRYVNNQKE